jgi:lipoyl(octanoyl) transferase
MGAELWTCHLGRVEYREALALQRRLRDARLAGDIPDVLLLLEHDPVYTRGRRSDRTDLPMGEEWHRMQGFDVVDTDRGGKVTYHGPGQLVGYPIMAVRDVKGFVARLESAVVAALADEGIAGRSRAADGRDFTGVWVEDRKIASIGLHVSHGVTTHGFAVNVDGDLQPFEWVVPCGLDGVRMTSVLKEHMAQRAADPADPADRMGCFRKRMAHRFAEAAGLRQRLVSRARIDLHAPLLESGNAPDRAPH